jgi:hypothetical protein
MDDTNKGYRRSIQREQDFKKFGKLGVSRTAFHEIQGLADCEYISINDLPQAVGEAVKMSLDTGKNVEAFLDQAAERLMRDSDLIPIGDLIGILNDFYRLNFFHLGFINKVKNETIYDVSRTTCYELGILLNAITTGWNVISPKLVIASCKRLGGSRDLDGMDLVVRALLKSPLSLIRRKDVKSGMTQMIQKIVENVSRLSYSETAILTRDLVNFEKKSGLTFSPVQDLVKNLLSKSEISDVESASYSVWVASRAGVIEGKLQESLRSALITRYPGATIESCNAEVGNSFDKMKRRNEAVDIASRIITSAHLLGDAELRDRYLPAISRDSVKGLRCHALVDLWGIEKIRNVLKPEIERKISSFSEKQRMIVSM